MTWREHGALTALSILGALLALFQCWYVFLPAHEAGAIDLCQLTRHIDCFQSLHKFGAELSAFGLPVFPALLSLFVFMAVLACLAWTAHGGRREAWLAAARLAGLPAAGLAAYVLFNDYLVAEATSVSGLLVGAIAFLIAGHFFARGGLRGVPLTTGAGTTLALLLGAALLGFFVHGAGTARHTIVRVEQEREAAPPQVIWPGFARSMPRTGAAWVGDPAAEREILLFLDPAQDASRALMREVAELRDLHVVIFLYARGEDGARLATAAAQRRLLDYLRAPDAFDADHIPAQTLVERQEAAMEGLGVKELPTALWKGGRRTGAFRLSELLRTIH